MATIKRLQIVFTIICVVFLGGLFNAAAHDKVVVIPLLGNEATGNATRDDVLKGKTFSNSSTTGLTGRRPPAPVEQTGQGLIYMSGDDGSLKKGEDWPVPRFSAGTYVVTDNLTGIMWQKSANNGEKDWSSAILYCNTLKLFVGGPIGYWADDWRLPNIKELQSLVDFGYVAPSLSDAEGKWQWSEGDPFTDVRSSFYWSSTTHAYFTTAAWYVRFWDGFVERNEKTNIHYVWCVRGGD